MGEVGLHSHLDYTTIPGYFLQDDPATDPATFDYASTNFGLINRTYDSDSFLKNPDEVPQWTRFRREVNSLNRFADVGVRYVLLYLGRHGEGYHNVAEAQYGTAAWDCHWSMLDGNGTITWADAHLTGQGIMDVKAASKAWATQIEHGIPTPETYYSSPLYRCLQTAQITFGTHNLPNTNPFKPTVKELLRETIGVHTCDRRSSRTYIEDHFACRIEHGFTESDTTWLPNLRESDSARAERLRRLLDDILEHDDSTFISMTSHSAAIASILEVIGHRKFPLATAAVIPVLLRIEKIPGPAPTPDIQPWAPPPKCDVDI